MLELYWYHDMKCGQVEREWNDAPLRSLKQGVQRGTTSGPIPRRL